MILNQVYHEEKSHADWTNWQILEQMNREEKNTKLSVASLLIKSLWFNQLTTLFF